MKKEVKSTSYADELIKLMQEAKAGKIIQAHKKNGKAWQKVNKLNFDFENYDYRAIDAVQQICVGYYIDADTKEKLDLICQEAGTTINQLFKNDLKNLIDRTVQNWNGSKTPELFK